MDIHCCLFIESTRSPLDYFTLSNIYLKEGFILDILVWTRHQMMLGSHIRWRRQLLNLAMVYNRHVYWPRKGKYLIGSLVNLEQYCSL